jgi:site-specific DNA-methyltransferase (adenine-specific)
MITPYYEEKDITIFCGDCLEIMKEIPDKSIDLVLTDPPYGHNNNNGDLISRWEAALGRGDYIPERDNRPIINDGIEANKVFEDFLNGAERVLKLGSCCCCCCCGGGPDPMFANWSLAMNKIFDFKQMVVWDKGPMGMGWHYRRSYETVLVATKRGGACKWYDKTKKIENIIRPNYKGIKKIIPRKTDHPTPKPIELMKHFIELHSQKTDIVLDPFCGGGTTAVACKELGRKCIGIEISEEYCKSAVNRIKNTQRSML